MRNRQTVSDWERRQLLKAGWHEHTSDGRWSKGTSRRRLRKLDALIKEGVRAAVVAPVVTGNDLRLPTGPTHAGGTDVRLSLAELCNRKRHRVKDKKPRGKDAVAANKRRKKRVRIKPIHPHSKTRRKHAVTAPE